jgi:hypothetical protein
MWVMLSLGERAGVRASQISMPLPPPGGNQLPSALCQGLRSIDQFHPAAGPGLSIGRVWLVIRIWTILQLPPCL